MLASISKLRLIHRFTDINVNEINPDQLLLKPKWNWTTPFTKNKEFENLIRNLSTISFYNVYKQDNIKNLHEDLNELISLTISVKIITQKADRGSIAIILTPEFH